MFAGLKHWWYNRQVPSPLKSSTKGQQDIVRLLESAVNALDWIEEQPHIEFDMKVDVFEYSDLMDDWTVDVVGAVMLHSGVTTFGVANHIADQIETIDQHPNVVSLHDKNLSEHALLYYQLASFQQCEIGNVFRSVTPRSFGAIKARTGGSGILSKEQMRERLVALYDLYN
jgi:hypothetical protein